LKHKVLHIIDSFEQGGTERQAIQLVRLLQSTGCCDVHLACLQKQGSLYEEVARLSLGEIQEYPLTSFYDRNFTNQVWRLIRFLKANEIEVVHTHDFYTNIFGMIAATMARVSARIASKRETNGFRSPNQKRAERVAFRLAHRVVANSEVVRQQLIREGVRAEKVVKLYNGLDLERLETQPNVKREDVLGSIGLPLERSFVTIVANLNHAVKDHPTFLRAAERIHRIFPNAGFVIAGEGRLLPGLRELACQFGIEQNVFFLGRCDRVAQLLFASDVCVLSSTAEGFSNAILEYMAAARPVVVTDVGGAREAVLEGETGYIVSPGDDESMAERIIQLLREPSRAREMGKRAKQRVIEQFSTERQVDSTLQLYGKLLARDADAANREMRAEVSEARALARRS
jgi:glycosyltransferase involved in cell wall biosynthesis